jgi:hypothetical protein
MKYLQQTMQAFCAQEAKKDYGLIWIDIFEHIYWISTCETLFASAYGNSL